MNVCPGCDEEVQNIPPKSLVPGLLESWSHLDGEPLCPAIGPNGYKPAQPVKGKARV